MCCVCVCLVMCTHSSSHRQWFRGSEQQHLSTLIFLQIKHQVLESVFSSIADKVSNAKIRVMVTEKVEGVISSTGL